ncbi:MAG TPA: BMP family ABC transporter substrate-binding protein [Acidimicrobiia bacterium]|nr:BMP family ABC transporter substrate-binding protein [Acidimicrobiia bacterium]
MKFRILGTVEAEVDGTLVDLGPPKQRALLALLLLNANQIVSSDRLIDLIWGEAAPRTAAHSLQIYVSELRKRLGSSGDRIETRSPGYVLKVHPGELDSLRFQQMVESGDVEQLRNAMELWVGEPISDFAYEEWAQPHIRRLRGLWARALEMLAAAELEDGRAAEVPEVLDALIAREPLREEPRRLLMLALYRSGRQAEALRSYREFRDVLFDEMGVEPSSYLTQLEEQILLQDPALAPERWVRVTSDAPARNPYKGLGAFDEIDAADFFGRDKLVSEMVDALANDSRLVVLVGPSGSGKSSAVRAGLIPALREGRVPGSDQWVLSTMMPGRHPFEQLEAALVRVSRTPVPTILEQLTESETGLLRVALRIISHEQGDLLLFVDQFEELFILSTERERRRFLDSLVTAVTDPRSRVRVVLTLRADFYDRPLLSHRFAPVFASSVVNVLPLSPAELEAAIVEPAASVNVEVQSQLLAQLIADVGEEAQALPLLQYTLTELFDHRLGRTLDLNAYHSLGGLEGALTTRADYLFEAFDAQGQDATKRLFLQLVRSDRGSEPARRRVALDDLRQIGEFDEILGTFIAHRLLTADRDAMTGKATIQVTHEALLDGWGRLRGWIEEYATDLLRRSSLSTTAAEWEASGEDSDYLLTGGRLAQLEAWSRETTLALAPLERAFLQASIDQRALPPIALVSEGPIAGSLGDLLGIGFDKAVAELGEGVVAQYTAFWWQAQTEVKRLAEAGVQDFVVVAGFGGNILNDLASDFPENRFALIDWSGEEPNVQYVNFAAHEGSFLVGAIAALRSETNIIGFVGAIPTPLILNFQAGFEAGARHVRPDVAVLAEYLAPAWDFSGFDSKSLGQAKSEPLYRAGADVIFHAAGGSGQGVFEAARVESAAQGRHLWAIGVDADEFLAVLKDKDINIGGPDPRTWQPHILTSMVIRWDTAAYTLVKEFAGDQFRPGPRMFRLADDMVGYSTTGGFIEDLVPTIEDLKARIIAGEIFVPERPST